MMNDEQSRYACEAICRAAELVRERVFMTLDDWCRPSVIYRPRLSIDGNQWCALYGDNLQDGVAGFGDSPNEAMFAFDRAWNTRLGDRKP